jgi:hypothetical protein
MSDSNSNRLAVLIDADNAPPGCATKLMNEIASYGTATVRRAYGDWTTPNLCGWRDHLHTLAIQPVQQFRLTTGKNATDSALIIEAMDLLHGSRLDGFCLVSSDSDFTRLATRIRESGLRVYGFGERKTPKPFVAACNEFVFTEDLRGTTAASKSLEADTEYLQEILSSAVRATARTDGWAFLGEIGSRVRKEHPEFDKRKYGAKSLGNLVRQQSYLEVRNQPTTDGVPSGQLSVRIKEC